jgi:tetratricopeptide (TPR) repeat protein
MRMAIRRTRTVPFVMLVLAVGGEGLAAPPAEPATNERLPAERRPAKVDADQWARRSVELLRWAVEQPDQSNQSDASIVVGFSLQFNTLLMRDPYAAQVADLAEKYQAKVGAPAKGYDMYIALLRRPEAERLKQLPVDASKAARDARAGEGTPPNVYRIGGDILNLPPAVRAEREPVLISQMEQAARQQQEWGRLGLAYWRLAQFALHDKKPEQAGRYIDRMTEVVREHPIFQDPNHGNTDAVDPSALADVMLRAGRRAELEKWVEAEGGEVRAELAVGLVGELAKGGDFDAAGTAVEKYLRPSEPGRAGRLAAALEGKVVLPPPEPDRRKRNQSPAAELRLRGAQGSVASGFAARGDVETAARMLVELRRVTLDPNADDDQIAAFEWAGLARRALQHGHTDATRRAFAHAIDALKEDTLMKEAEREEKARLVRQAIALGNFELADAMLHTGSRPGAWARLEIAQTYRKLGDPAKALAALDDALAQAYGPDVRAGAAMAEIAVELQVLGEGKRAEKVLLDAFPRIEGVDFGFGGTAAVVAAAARMDRLDLLDRLYEPAEPGNQLLLCITASRAAVNGIEEKR